MGFASISDTGAQILFFFCCIKHCSQVIIPFFAPSLCFFPGMQKEKALLKWCTQCTPLLAAVLMSFLSWQNIDIELKKPNFYISTTYTYLLHNQLFFLIGNVLFLAQLQYFLGDQKIRDVACNHICLTLCAGLLPRKGFLYFCYRTTKLCHTEYLWPLLKWSNVRL